MTRRCLLMGILPLTAVTAADQPGLRARHSASSYPGHTDGSPIAVGAELLSGDEVRNTFATELNRGFLVIEAGVFPADGKSWNVQMTDFSLRIGTDKYVRPVAAATIASILQSKALGKHKQGSQGGGPGDITLYPSTNVGYESGPSVYDPVTGRRRGGGWTTGAGVGVGVGGQQQGPVAPPPPGSSDADRTVMGRELQDKALPEGEIHNPVAGYLYFPVPTEGRRGGGPDPKKAYELLYQSGDVKLRTALPAPK